MTWLLTASGTHFDLVDPQPDMVNVLDIAQGLANECRYTGQCRWFYSVAQHATLASHIVEPEFALEALLHDASEAYLKDLPRPLKQLLPDYRHIERRVEAVIRAKFGLPPIISEPVHRADLIMLATERRDLVVEDATEWEILRNVTPLDKRIRAKPPRVAESLFIRRLLEIGLS
jgi:uncharacterized protein